MHMAITSTQMSVGYCISDIYCSILSSHPCTWGIWLPEYFSSISNFNHPTLAMVATTDPRPTWLGGSVNDIDCLTSIAYVTGPPPINGGTCPTND